MNDLIGLAVLAWPLTLAAIILLALAVVTSTVWYLTRRRKGHWLWTLGAALLVYLAVFWDHIPTVVAHRYYCDKEAGFWVYKTPEQWKKENPGAMEALVANKGAPSERKGDMTNYADTYFLNPRFNWVVKRNGRLFPNRWRHEQEVVDAVRGEVLARYIDFSTSQDRPQAGWSGWKFWLANEHCGGGEWNASNIRQFRNNFGGAEK